MIYDLDFFKYGDSSILITWPKKIDENILNDLLDFKIIIENHKFKQIVEVTHSYNSILIIYNKTIDNINSVVNELKHLYGLPRTNNFRPSVTWEIPVCYDEKFGLDMITFCTKKNISQQRLIELHSSPHYTVYFLGFLPGFPYLGGLDSQLHTNRKSQPRLVIPKGSVAIGGEQTGIYPQDSPGGWHIIGKTPINLFDPKLSPASPFQPGHKIRFKPISIEEFQKIETLFKDLNYTLKPIH